MFDGMDSALGGSGGALGTADEAASVPQSVEGSGSGAESSFAESFEVVEEAAEAVEVVEAEQVEAAAAPSAFAFTQPPAEVQAAAVATAEAQEAPSAFAFTQPPAVNDEPPDRVAAAVEEAATEESVGTATEAADISAAASGGDDTGASRLVALRNRLEEAEDQMQIAVDNDDFEAASELQEVVDALTDEIDQLEASL